MGIYDKEFVVLRDGAPLRYYKDGQIKTYMTRDNAEKQAKREIKDAIARKAWREKTYPERDKEPVPKFQVGRFSAIDLEEVTLDDANS